MYKQDAPAGGGKGGTKGKKQRKCAQFQNAGSCRYGDVCCFSHDTEATPAKGKGKGKTKGKGKKRAKSVPAVRTADETQGDENESEQEGEGEWG